MNDLNQQILWILLLPGLIFISSEIHCNNSKTAIQDHAHKELLSFYAKGKIVIDARLNEVDWSTARSIIMQDDSSRSADTAIVRTVWDKQNLYIAFQVRDKNLQSKQITQDHPLLAHDDIVEFLIDTHNDKGNCWTTDDFVYHINLLGQKKDDRGTADCKSDSKWNGHADIAVQYSGTLNDAEDEDVGYIIELSIPWKELEVQPYLDAQLGIDFGIGDGGEFFDWVGARPFRSPKAFGNLILEN